MALGQLTNGITVREMSQAYCAFVNDGVFTHSRSYSLVTDSEGNEVIDNSPSTIQAFKPNTAHVMTYMMQNAVENGTGGEAALWTMPVAGKTGTSTDYKDRWFVGCTPYYVAAVWTGYDTPERVQTSSNPAAKAWKKVMSPIHEGLTWQSFTYPLLEGNTGIFGIEDTYYNDRYEDDFSGYTDEYGGMGGGYVVDTPDYDYDIPGEDIYADSFGGAGYTMTW